MSQIPYKNPSDFVKLLNNYFEIHYYTDLFSGNPIIHRWCYVDDKSSINPYLKAISRLSYLFNVKIYIDPDKINFSIYIVGNASLVHVFFKYLSKLIAAVGSNMEKVMETEKHTHPSFTTRYKVSMIKKFHTPLLLLDKYQHRNLTDPLRTKELDQQALIEEYANQINVLKIRTPLSWEVK